MTAEMTHDDVLDWIDDLQATLPPAEWTEQLLTAVAQMPVGAAGRAEALHSLGEGKLLDDDPAGALAHFEGAVADGGWSTIDPRSGVAQALLVLGRDTEADAFIAATRRELTEVRSEAPLPMTMGEVLELAGRHREAERWYTIGLREFDPEIDDPDDDEETCLWGRFRVRRLRGAPLDRFDTWVLDDDPEWLDAAPSV